ncbi:MAG: transcriptional activator NhaR [bacterium]
MTWLNYHHLFYFYVVAKAGNLTAAADSLHLAPSTLSAQIKTLEESLGVRLFDRTGRMLVLTERGQVAFEYASEIFNIGSELIDTFQTMPSGRVHRLVVGVSDVLWKDIAWHLIEPALTSMEGLRITCVEGTFDELVSRLAVHSVDVVLTDSPLTPTQGVRAFNHVLGSSSVALITTREHASKLEGDFPFNLEGAAVFLPTEKTSLRRHLDQWFESLGIHPVVMGEFDDSALMSTFGIRHGAVFPVPSVIADDWMKNGDLVSLGTADAVTQSFYAISPERRVKHPAVLAICEAARKAVFR